MNEKNLFDIQSAKSFFDSIVNVRKKYSSGNTKNIEQLLYIIMGLNHLREWIAPGYKHKNSPTKPEHHFFKKIYENQEFKKIKSICNRTKHLSESPYQTTVQHSDKLADWDNLSAAKTLGSGVPIDYYVEGRNVLDSIDEVIDFYNSNWFSIPEPPHKNAMTTKLNITIGQHSKRYGRLGGGEERTPTCS